MKTALFLSALALAAAAATFAEARPARCVITNEGRTVIRGPCEFHASRGGSFWVDGGRNQEPLAGEVAQVSVSVSSRGRGQARSLTTHPGGYVTNGVWGDVARSRSDPACWVGSGFRICVY
jgi:hypothetical protein